MTERRHKKYRPRHVRIPALKDGEINLRYYACVSFYMGVGARLAAHCNDAEMLFLLFSLGEVAAREVRKGRMQRQLFEVLETAMSVIDDIFPTPSGKPLCIDTSRLTVQRLLKRPVTMHGCRSTFRDWCEETGVPWALAEKSLMHTTGSEVERAYQRSDLLEQRRPVMQAWADALFEGEQAQKK